MMQREEDCARLIGFSMIFVSAVYFHNNENAPFWLLYNHFTRYFFLSSSFQHLLWHPHPTRPALRQTTPPFGTSFPLAIPPSMTSPILLETPRVPGPRI